MFAKVAPAEEFTCDHSTEDLVSGQCCPLPIWIPVVNGDRLLLDRAVLHNSVARKCCIHL